jgi:hypothetical protein
VEDTALVPGRFTLRGEPARLTEIGKGQDPWADFWRHRYGFAAAQRKLAGLG